MFYQNISNQCFLKIFLASADNVSNFNAVKENSTTSTRVTWTEPVSPNGQVLLYTIRYQRLDGDNVNAETICLPVSLFLNSTTYYTLQNLHTGNYSVELRATSLAGNGAWTAKKYFYIVSIF